MSNLKISDFNATMAYVLGFNTKKDLLNFIKKYNVNVNKPFDSIHIDILKIKNQLLQQQQNQFNDLLKREKIRKSEIKKKNIERVREKLMVMKEKLIKERQKQQFKKIIEMEKLRKNIFAKYKKIQMLSILL